MSAWFTSRHIPNRFTLPLIVGILFIASCTVTILFPMNNAYSMDITLAWDQNTEPNLAGYRIFCREENQPYNYQTPSWEGADTTCTINDLDDAGTYYFVARSFDNDENESYNSNEVRYPPLPVTDAAMGGGCFIDGLLDRSK